MPQMGLSRIAATATQALLLGASALGTTDRRSARRRRKRTENPGAQEGYRGSRKQMEMWFIDKEEEFVTELEHS